MFKDKRYYINKTKEVLGMTAAAILFALFILACFIMA